MSKKNPDILGKVFRNDPITWNGLTFYRFSLETQLIVMDAELTFLYDPSIKLSVKEQIQQMTEFLYIHATEPELLRFKTDDPDAFRDGVRQFARKIPMTGMIGLQEVVAQIVAGIAEASVDIHEKPGGSSKETAPPN